MIKLLLADKKVDFQHIVILCAADKVDELGELSKKEAVYAKSLLADDKKLLVIHRLDGFVAIAITGGDKPNAKQLEDLRKNGATICGVLADKKATHCIVKSESSSEAEILALTEGLALASYRFLKYKKEETRKKESLSLQEVHIQFKGLKSKDLDELSTKAEAVFRARDLVNEPVVNLSAVDLADYFKNLAKESGVKAEVLNKPKIEALKMGGLLAVNKGSKTPPTFTILEYKPNKPKNKKPIVLVGKGVVYDTGGLSLKPTPNSMDYMKSDMAGAALVGNAICAAAQLKLPLHIVALIPATDNRPGEEAYTPGDVITMHNGLTVEVLNTDAEGRMILADALSYAKNYSPELVLEFSTLTGAAAAAIGQYGIVYMGTAGEKVKSKLTDAGERVYERLVEFPFWDEYAELIKSDIADMKNIGGPIAGAITAGKFLERFTDYPYLHFDIAGGSFIHSNDSYRGKNGTGMGVRMLLEFLENYHD